MVGGRAHFREVVADLLGNVIPGASVLVLNEGTSTPITQSMYGSDALIDLTPLSNPLISNANGIVDFYTTSPQDVDLVISKTGYTTQYLYNMPVGPGGLVGTFTPTALAIGGVGAQGTSNIPAPGDHAHGMPSFGVHAKETDAVGTDGIATTVARSDHRHGSNPMGYDAGILSISNTTTYTTLTTGVCPANSLHTGSVLRVRAWGEVFNNSGGTLVLNTLLLAITNGIQSVSMSFSGISIPTDGGSRYYLFDATCIFANTTKGEMGGYKTITGPTYTNLYHTAETAEMNSYNLAISTVVTVEAKMNAANALFRVSTYGLVLAWD